jgi:hypothetical protein
MPVVYKHIRLDNNSPFYIGIGKTEKRAYSKNGRTEYWRKIVKKCGYEVEILFDNISYDIAKEKEIEFIKLYGRANINSGILCNLTDGGDGSLGFKHSSESLIKIGEKSKNRVKSIEQINKWKNSMKNYIISNETKDKIKKTLTGIKHTEERKNNQSKSHLGKTLSQETKEKISILNKGKKKPPITEKHRKNLSLSHIGKKGIFSSNKKAVINIKKDGDTKEYFSMSEASYEKNISLVTLKSYILKKTTPKDGSIWIFKNNLTNGN